MRIIIFLAVCLVAVTFIVISLIKNKEKELISNTSSSFCRNLVEQEDALLDHIEEHKDELMYCYCKQ